MKSSFSHLLIVDEDKSLGHGIGLALKDQFDQISITHSPVNAKRMIRQNRYFLIITEINFTTTNGLVMIREMKELQPTTNIIVISAHVSGSTREKLKRFGIAKMLEKPIDMNILRSDINHLIEKRKERS